jgi:endo-1,4-beta-D-glucanase Y
MGKRKLIMLRIYILFFLIFFINIAKADPTLEQWEDSEKTYKDLIDEGFEVKSYSTNNIKTRDGLIFLLFITVLQKEKTVFECQEYQTLDESMKTLDMKLVCRKLIQPYKRGIGT